jgi:hypothetical protein
MHALRLADVRLPLAILGAAVFVRAALFPHDLLRVRLVWMTAAVSCILFPSVGAWLVAALAWHAVVTDYYNHILFIAWIASTFALFPNADRAKFVLRWQLSILYGFAAIAKTNANWLSGEPLTRVAPSIPEHVVMLAAAAALLGEAFLAIGLWIPRLRPAVLMVAVAMHLTFWLLISTSPLRSFGLIPFGILAVGMVAWATRRNSGAALVVP